MSSDASMEDTGDSGRRTGPAPDAAALLDAGASACRAAADWIYDWTTTAALYLRARRPRDIAADAVQRARERPGQALAAAALLGLLAGGALYACTRPRGER